MSKFLTTYKTKLQNYWSLTKSLQTGLLLTTGVAGFMSARCPFLNWTSVLQVAGSLFLAVSGSTILNMWYDRDIDAKMHRTCARPFPTGEVKPIEGLILGAIISTIGVGWALSMDLLYGSIVFAGLFFDVVVYTLWLKRRTAWSIIWGGISGGMPILAGRAFGLGYVDWIGILLSLAILFWIPTHILTFSMRYRKDYQRAGIPTFPSTYGDAFTIRLIAASSVLVAIAITASTIGLGLTFGFLRLLAVLSFGLILLAFSSIIKPSERLNFGLFKYASLFMLSTMLVLIAQAI